MTSKSNNNKNNKNNNNNPKRKTHTPSQISHFNTFLRALDEKQHIADLENNLHESIKETNFSEDKKSQIQTILKHLDISFVPYETKFFTGKQELDNCGINDPDLFSYQNPNPSPNICSCEKSTQRQNPTAKSSQRRTISISDELFFNKKPVEITIPAIETRYTGPKEKKTIHVVINTISDLLKLIDDYKLDEKIEYNINLEALHNIKEPLHELNNMVGMHDLKTNIVDQILYFSQNLHKISKNGENSGDYMHTVIYGPPGTGKTEIAKIMGKIYSKMGILKRGVFRKVTRSDLIAGYLGQTAMKTKDVITECLGGVLFIDEAYSLGNSDKKDSFSKECIDTLCEALSDNKDNLMVIVAGYENELKECFFGYNQGLESRFTWNFRTEDYKGKELFDIFSKKVNDIGWLIDEESKKNIDAAWFEKNIAYFKYYGRDMEVLLSKIKIAHSRRVFCLDSEEKMKITCKDLEKGFEMYLKNDEVKKRKEDSNTKMSLSSMYV